MSTNAGNPLGAVYELLADLGRRARMDDQNTTDCTISEAQPSEAGDADDSDRRQRNVIPGNENDRTRI